MKATKKIGIYMNHSKAHLIEFPTSTFESKTINSKFQHVDKERTLSKNENLMHNKEQHEQAEYYRQLGEILRNYDEVVLFGPTNAKQELHNTLKDNHLFEKIRIETKETDKMLEKDQLHFVENHFLNSYHSI